VLVSHAYGHFIDYGGAVRVGGLTIAPGDLIHADVHGALIIPRDADLMDLAARCDQIEALERELFALAQSSQFTVDALATLWQDVVARWPSGQKVGDRNL
jgi:regulator of RNase E activity RraA